MNSKKTLEIYPIDVTKEKIIFHRNRAVDSEYSIFPKNKIELSADLNKEIIKNPASTFLGRVIDDSMKDMDIKNGDILVIDRSLPIENRKLFVCYIDGEFALKYIKEEQGSIQLITHDSKTMPIEVTKGKDSILWGRVIRILRNPQDL